MGEYKENIMLLQNTLKHMPNLMHLELNLSGNNLNINTDNLKYLGDSFKLLSKLQNLHLYL